MKKLISIFVFIAVTGVVILPAQSLGQTYKTALGLKVWGDGGGISVKNFVSPTHAVEGVGYFWDRGARIVGLYEFHGRIDGAPGLNWYVGPGAHVGFYNKRYYDDRYFDGDGSGSFIGLDGVLGLDYKFDGVPINLSIDWQPSFEFGVNRGFIGSWEGLVVRYTL
ncbi:MAG TPA: hypothetical protein PK185_08705 [Cyclobacteriaceae bacterium]|nr:hypothetical protein [Cyclobacteriaceae bacterium]